MIPKKTLILMIFESSKKYCKLLTPIQRMRATRKKKRFSSVLLRKRNNYGEDNSLT